MKNILVTRSSMPSLDEYVEEIRSIWDSHWLTNMGEKHKKLQAELEKYLGIPHVALYTNGHLALENVIAALNLPKGGEVITTPFTFASTTHAIVRNGLIPVFCDVNENDYTGWRPEPVAPENGGYTLPAPPRKTVFPLREDSYTAMMISSGVLPVCASAVSGVP